MIPVTSKVGLILEQLQDRVNIVKMIGSQLPNQNPQASEKFKHFLNHISYFIHYIVCTPELNDEISRLLEYEKRNKATEDFKELANKASAEIKRLGKFLCKLPNIEEKCNAVDIRDIPNAVPGSGSRWANVFKEDVPPIYANSYMNTKELLKYMSLGPDFLNWSKRNIDTLSEILFDPRELHSVYHYWSDQTELDLGLFINTISSLKDLSRSLEYIEEFNYEFENADAAENLMRLYNVTNPHLSKNMSWELSLHKQVLATRDSRFDIDTYILYCEKLLMHFKALLSTRILKKTIIERFKTFIEIFRYNEFQGGNALEKELQKEFEEFMFYNGLFPLSEVQLGNGRLDTLSINHDEGFLVEIKQVGFGKSKESNTSIKSKIEFGMHEPSIYHARLANLPQLSPEVHVVVFTKIPFRLTTDMVRFNALNYFFYIIDLSGIAPSKQGTVQMVDPNSLFIKTSQ